MTYGCQGYTVITMEADNLEQLRAEIRKVADTASMALHRTEAMEARMDKLESEEKEILAGLMMIKAYLKRSTEVSAGIKTTLKVLIAIVSLASAVSSILRFVCYL